MASDLIYGMSPKELKLALETRMTANPQPLLDSAKRFLAVAAIQQFDRQPISVETAEMDALISGGHLELHRGLRPAFGQSAAFYATQTRQGIFFPGRETAFGHGMYFSEVSVSLVGPPDPSTGQLSQVALRYATRDGAQGAILRACLKPDAYTTTRDTLRERFRDDKNRLRKSDISELGTYAAALGYDAFSVERPFAYSDETTWVVLNREVLICQSTDVKIPEQVLTAG